MIWDMVQIPPPNHYSHLQSRVRQVRLGGGRVMADGASYPPGPPLTVDGCRMACSIYRATAHAQGTGWRGMRRACAASWHYFAPAFASVSAYFSWFWQGQSVVAKIYLLSAALFSSFPSLLFMHTLFCHLSHLSLSAHSVNSSISLSLIIF